MQKRTNKSVLILFRVVTILLFCSLLFFQIHKTFVTSPQYDDSYNASVAKNLALGVGYKTTYDTGQLFNPEISTGPTLIIPASILIGIFGNQYWVPSLTTVIAIVVLLLLIFFLSKRLFSISSNVWKFGAIAFLFLILFSSESLKNWGFLRLWYLLLGEIPAALLVILGYVIIFRRPMTKGSLFLAGIVLALSFLTKFITILAFLSICSFLLITVLISEKQRLARLIIMGFLVFGFALPPSAFSIVKRFSVGDSKAWQALKRSENEFIKNNHSGLAILNSENKPELIRENFSRNGKVLSDYFGSRWQIFLFVLLVSTIILTSIYPFSKVSTERPAKFCGILLIIAFLIHLGWWLFFSPTGWIRHLIPGFVYVFVGLSLLLSLIAGYRAVIFFTILLTLLVFPRIQVIKLLIPRNSTKEPRLIALLETKKYLQEKVDSNSILVGCGWWANRDLEYLLPSSGNFKDCLTMPYNQLNQPIVLVRSEFWNWEKSEFLKEFQETCDKNILFKYEPFYVSLCNEYSHRAEVEHEATVIDFGTPEARRHMLNGWSVQDEKNSDGATFVWGIGEKSTVELFFSEAREIQMTFRCLPFQFPGSPSQTISIAVNGKQIELITLYPGSADYQIVLPRQAFVQGKNQLEFRYAYTRTPKDVVSGMDDARPLAVLWHYIHFGPAQLK